MTFEELPIEEQEKWNRFAEEHQDSLKILAGLLAGGCPHCGYKTTRYADMQVHIQTTHGLSHELLDEIITNPPHATTH